MAKLDEIRKWLRGDETDEDLPDHWKEQQKKQEEFERETGDMPKRKGLDMERVDKLRGGGRYTVSMDGSDAVLNFGKFRGEAVSLLAQKSSGRGYLRWILREDFPQELKDIIHHYLGSDDLPF